MLHNSKGAAAMQQTGLGKSRALAQVMPFRAAKRRSVAFRPAAANNGQPQSLPGGSVTPRPSSPGTEQGPQRTQSALQGGFHIPGLASALNLISGVGHHNSNSGGSSVSAASGHGHAADNSSPNSNPDNKNGSNGNGSANGAPDMAFAASAASTANGNGYYGPTSAANGRSTRPANGSAHHHADDTLTIAEALPSPSDEASATGMGPTANNISPYSVNGIKGISSPVNASLAIQIREIASTLRHINSLRVEYMDKISQQELELSAKDQALRARDEKLLALEKELSDLRQSLGLLHGAKSAAEEEVVRLRAALEAAKQLPAPASAPAPAQAALPAAAAAPTAAADAPSAAAAAAPPPAATPAPAPAAAPHVVVERHASVDYPPQPGLVAMEHAPPDSNDAAVPAAAPAAPAAAPPPPPPPPAPKVPEIVISYRSSWDRVFLHFNVDGKGWTNAPGVQMENAGNKEKVARVQGRSIEFVINNGAGEWDSPPGGPGRNYTITAPGQYRLHYGTITQTAPWSP